MICYLYNPSVYAGSLNGPLSLTDPSWPEDCLAVTLRWWGLQQGSSLPYHLPGIR